MSALGQKQTLMSARAMSALPPKADIGTQSWNVRFVPKADICGAANSSLFDHLVGASTYRLRNGEAQCFGSLEIDYKLILCGRLYGKIGWLRALENAIDIDGGARRNFRRIRSVRGKASARGVIAQPVNARHAIPDCQRSNLLEVTGCCTQRQDQTAVRLIRKRRNCAFDLASVARIDCAQIHADRRCRGLDRSELTDPSGQCGITEDCRPRHVGCDLFKQFDPFSRQAVFKCDKSSLARPGGNTTGFIAFEYSLANTIGTLRVTCCSDATFAL